MTKFALFLAIARAAMAQQPEGALYGYLNGIAQQQLSQRRAEVAAITTKEAYELRKTRLRAAALKMIGPLAEPRTPLNARTTGKLDRADYVVEKVIYESRPRFFVTANLYLPKSAASPVPAVLHPVGHSTSAKNRAFYQRISIGLVKQGFAVLIYDPIGQGERRIFWDNDLGDSKAGGTTAEHSMVGWQSLLAGESVAQYRIWDGMRGIDYLQSRPEVDKDRIGVTGCSGGGTLTTYIAALDPRVKAAAPACYISSWEDQLNGTGPQDAEQQFPDQLLAGLNHSDWIGLAAPIPYLIVSTDQDFFPLEGARKSFEEMKRVYGLYDASGKIGWFHEPGGHGVPLASREAIYTWMKNWLKGEAGAVKEPEFETEHEEDLNATQTGQVATSLGGETASTWNIKRYRDMRPARPVSRIRELVTELTRYRKSQAPLNLQREGERITFQSDEGHTVFATLMAGSGDKAAIYMGPKAGAGDLAQLGYTVLAIDVPAAGAKTAWLALMAGRPLIGLRMNDIARAIDALAALNLLPGKGVVAYGKGRHGAAVLHAAVVDDRIRAVIVEGSLVSYAAVAAAPIHRDIEEIAIPGVLGRYDLPDLAASLGRPVSLINMTSPTGRLLFRREVEQVYPGAEAPNTRVMLRREEDSLSPGSPFADRLRRNLGDIH
ncbi:MAG: acetylxylan esterase [Bryobacteraceae bacterium]|nr:acetylxylan esterase [Bryobacteraceae bacterium]